MEEIISIGNRVDMELLIDGLVEQDSDRRRTLTSKVMDMPRPNQVRVAMPFYDGRMVPLSIGDQYLLYFLTEKGIYSSEFTVVERMRDGNLYMADMEMMKGLAKIQRREFFRHDCRINAGYRIVTENEMDELTEDEYMEISWNPCVIRDISGGGVRMFSNTKEQAHQFIQLRMLLMINGEQKEFLPYGKLIHCEPNPNKPDQYELRVEYENMGERDRDQIIRYVFSEERKKIMKEKGLE